MRFKLALTLFLGAALLMGIALIANVTALNAICYTLASLLMIGAVAAAIGPRSFVIVLLVYAAIAALYLLAFYLAPGGEIPHA